MAASEIDYPRILQRALRGVVREVLDRAARDGLPGEHHFYLGLRTDHPGVELPSFLRQRYPEEMTVVLQHQFWDLRVDEEGFAVTLRFDGEPARLVVPYDAVVAFLDPTAEFGLRFDVVAFGGLGQSGGPAAPADQEGQPSKPEREESPPDAEPENGAGKVLSFGRGRDKREGG